jgi:hypothetical protein
VMRLASAPSEECSPQIGQASPPDKYELVHVPLVFRKFIQVRG